MERSRYIGLLGLFSILAWLGACGGSTGTSSGDGGSPGPDSACGQACVDSGGGFAACTNAGGQCIVTASQNLYPYCPAGDIDLDMTLNNPCPSPNMSCCLATPSDAGVRD